VVLLTTGVGVRSWFAAAESAGLDDQLREACGRAVVLARGPKARSAAIGVGLEVEWQAADETGVELLEELARRGAKGVRVAVQRDGGDPLLADGAASLGADVVDVPVYRWRPPAEEGPARRLLQAAAGGRLQAVTFTCAQAVRNSFTIADDPDAIREAFAGPVRAVAVGPVTADALREEGVTRIVEPVRGRLGAMVKALVGELSASHRLLRWRSVEARWQGSAIIHDDDRVSSLTPGEARLLELLAERPHVVVPKPDLAGAGADQHAVEAAIGRLRSKLGPLGGAVRTIPRRGYACDLTCEPAPVAEAAGATTG
jgi:uroporphyrinogen-III synthase